MNTAHSTYDDVLLYSDADAYDAQLMSTGAHYNYSTQTWVDGHDHAHMISNNEHAPLTYCGADYHTCAGA